MSTVPFKSPVSSLSLSEALARRLEDGAAALADFAKDLSETEWLTRGARDKRPIGVVIHHVASVYPVEIGLAQKLAAGEAITGVVNADIDAMNAQHAKDFEGVGKDIAIALLKKNSAEAAAAIRAFSDEDLRRAAPVSLYEDAPLTCQFVLEDHAVRHSYHTLKLLRARLSR